MFRFRSGTGFQRIIPWWDRGAKPLVLLAIFAISFATPNYAVEPDEILADPALEARARKISTELRCVVCQNQSIDDSNAPLARDLRLVVREQLKTGASDAAVMDHIVARYGEFVLLRPRLNASTLLLWLTPLLLLGAGVIGLRRSLAARTAPTALSADSQTAKELSVEEQRRLNRLLAPREARDS